MSANQTFTRWSSRAQERYGRRMAGVCRLPARSKVDREQADALGTNYVVGQLPTIL